MTSEIKSELIKATGFKPPKGGFNDEQDELAALAKAALKLSNDDFDDLSDEAADWTNDAIKAINKKEIIEGFSDESDDDALPEDEDEDDDEDAGAENEESDNADDVMEDDVTEEAESEDEDEEDHEAIEAAQAAKAKKPAKQPAKAAKPKPNKPKARSNAADEPQPLATGKQLEGVKTRYDNLTGEKDRFGVVIGTKTHTAVQMYEKGTTSKQIQEELGEGPKKGGGRFYNILKRLSEAGHLVERTPDGVFKLTHKDDLPPKSTKPTGKGGSKK